VVVKSAEIVQVGSDLTVALWLPPDSASPVDVPAALAALRGCGKASEAAASVFWGNAKEAGYVTE